jgi:hypothetical protein
MRILGWVCLATIGAVVGCAASPQAQVVDLWAVRQGGVTTAGTCQTRADSSASPLIACCTGRRIRVEVLETDTVGAFSWPSGRVFVTRGLLDHLNDAAVTAAIAHELGHLLSDGHLQIIGEELRACPDPDREVRADAAGMELLAAAGLSEQPMVTMLKKVEPCIASSEDRRLAFEQRILLASRHIASEKLPTQITLAAQPADFKIR